MKARDPASTPSASTCFHLLTTASTAQSGSDILRVPSAGVSFLHRGAEGRAALSLVQPGSVGWAAMEPWASRRGRPGLVLALPAGTEAWVNGGQALPVAVLHDGDEILLACLKSPLLVARLLSPWRGPVPESLADATCPVCRAPVQSGADIYLCPCRAPVHLACCEPVAACPVCGQAILTKPAYAQAPAVP